MIIRRIFIILWLCLLSLSIYAQKQTIAVTVYADDSYPPYSYSEKGEAKGIYHQILITAFSQMPDYNVTIQPVPWKRGLKLLEKGAGFALYPPYKRLRDRPYIEPYSTPILEEKTVVFCNSEILNKIENPVWPTSFRNLTIGINQGFSIGGVEFMKMVRSGDINMESASSNKQNILKLLLKRVDCYINDRGSILWGLKKIRKDEQYTYMDFSKVEEKASISSEYGHLGYSKNANYYPFKQNFIKDFNSVIEKMLKDGRIEQIHKQFAQDSLHIENQ